MASVFNDYKWPSRSQNKTNSLAENFAEQDRIMRLVAAIVLAGIILKILLDATDVLFARGEAKRSLAPLLAGFGLIIAVVLGCIGILLWCK